MEGLDRERVREWYNGYSWGGNERVYNPFDVLLLLDERQFRNWWCETGNSTFLVNLLLEKGVPWYDLDGMVGSEELLSQFDVGAIAAGALLFQTGYLTVRERLEIGGSPRYRLGYPNREVRQSLNRDLLAGVLGAGKEPEQEGRSARLRDVLATGRSRGLGSRTAGVPGRRSAPVARQEPDGELRGLVCEPVAGLLHPRPKRRWRLRRAGAGDGRT